MSKKDQSPPPSSHPRWILKLLLLLSLILVGEGAARIVFHYNWRGFEKTRQLMAGETVPSPGFQLCIAQPYLLYIPTPRYQDKHGYQHNAHGYRGDLVPLRRRPGWKRILCLGGSTTYGWGVPKPEDTFPAHLQNLLDGDLPSGLKGVEVVNAGIPSGTTAEILTHYLFKFRYYKPDLVIINPGGNDARTLAVPYYHPDYSHNRRQIQLPEPLPKAGRILLKSRLIGLFVVPLLHGPYPNAGAFYNYEGHPPFAEWYSGVMKEGKASVPKDEIAFWRNLTTLIDEIKKDGAKILLVPFRGSPLTPYWPEDLLQVEEGLLKEIALEHNVLLAPFPASVITPSNWLDDCHTNSPGYLEKAQHVLPYVKKLL